MITLLVSGMLRPVEMTRSSCSSRKTMSMGRPPSWLRILPAEPARDRCRHHRADVTAELGDLLDQARAQVGMLECGHEEDSIDFGRQLAIGVRHLQFRLEVAHRAQAADDETGP